MKTRSLKKFIYLSIAAAVITIVLKVIAWYITDSVGLLSDAMESCVNLIAAIIALVMINIAEKPADHEHAFGHGKAEYFSSAIEGAMIIIAAFSIIWSAVPRLLHPQSIENAGIGLMVSVFASLINLAVGLILIRNGRANNSITLEADGKHLMTDVYTSIGVLLGILLVKLTGWLILDPIVAVGVALNILYTGYHLIQRSATGLLDCALSDDEITRIGQVMNGYQEQGITYHSLLTRQAGQRKFIELYLLVPGEWTVQEGHNLAEDIEKQISSQFDGPVRVLTHIEPKDDPVSMHDIGIDRQDW